MPLSFLLNSEQVGNLYYMMDLAINQKCVQVVHDLEMEKFFPSRSSLTDNSIQQAWNLAVARQEVQENAMFIDEGSN